MVKNPFQKELQLTKEYYKILLQNKEEEIEKLKKLIEELKKL